MQQLEVSVGEQNIDKLDPKKFTSSVKRILPRTDMLATSSLENLKDASLQGSFNSGYLFENQESREVDSNVVVVVVVVEVVLVVFETARCFQLRIEGNGLRAKLSEVDRRKARRVRKQQERRRRRELLFSIIL